VTGEDGGSDAAGTAGTGPGDGTGGSDDRGGARGDRLDLLVNGAPWAGRDGATVADLVAAWCPSPRGIAVARNDEVVPRSTWGTTALVHGDRIEIVTAAAGG
jgi:sulfur carrier protein